VALGWKPEYEAPTTLACNDRMHDDADCGPALFDACDAWSEEGGTDEALEAAIEKLRGVV
jgi:hypothetical protein